MKKNIIIIILSVLVVGLGGYIVYDKVINKSPTEENNISNSEVTENSKEIIDKKDAAFFDEYLKVFLGCNGAFVSRNTEEFTDIDMYYFISNYYIQNNKDTSCSGSSGECSFTFSKEEADDLIFKYFNKTEYNIENSQDGFSLTKNGNEYILKWVAVGCGLLGYVDPVVEYNGVNVKVIYKEYDNAHEDYTGKTTTFNLKYNNGNYNVIKIEK